MATKIFVNLPVKEVKRSMEFFTGLGYSFNPQFTDDNAACMVITDDIYAMLLTHDMFKRFTPKEVADATKTSEVLTALSVDSRDDVDRFVDEALRLGATATRPPEDLGFMYTRSFDDLDGHIWEIIWMDPAAINQ